MALIRIREEKVHLELEFLALESSNALSLAAAVELGAIVGKYRKWSKPVVVLSGHPKVFCSGGNLTDYKKLKTKAEGLKVNREIEKHLSAFEKWPVIKIAAVAGDVLGGGMEWLACFDFRFCAPGCALGFWQKRIGLSTGWGGGARWARILGEDRVRRLLLQSELLTPEAALRLGLIDRIVPAWKLRQEVERFVLLLDSEILNSLQQWSPRGEQKTFGRLWLTGAHQKFLANWRPR
jgi:enoyl-CoA hydratase/carnithine racemase